MNNFNASILVLFDNINEKTQEPDATKKILNNTVLEKQYLAYYLYRIWMKYKRLMVKVNGKTIFEEVLKHMEIPVKYLKLDIVYPMADKMTNKESNLDKIILKILKQFNECEQVYGQPEGQGPKDDDYQKLAELVEYKTIENIIQDIIQLKILLPNLSRPGSRYDVWGVINDILPSNNVI